MGQVIEKGKAFKRLELLVKRFKNDLSNGDISGSHPDTVKNFPATEKGKKYSESQIRQGYILPMYRDVLGWDIDNSINEVIPELHNHEGFADFVFVRNNQRKFVLETKKPFVNVDPNYSSGRNAVRQAIGYARSLKDVSLAIVSNFELLVFSHSYVMPLKGEEQKNVLKWMHFDDFLKDENFEALWQFRHEACSTDSFAKELLKDIDIKLIKNHKTVDKNLLDDLKNIRVILANSIRGVMLLTPDVADNLTQHLINRIIFVRVLEDRGIITDKLVDLIGAEDIWKVLKKRFALIYEKFPLEILNTKTKHHLDAQTTHFKNKALEQAIQMFYDRGAKYFHDCYDFKYIPSDILGYAYEHSIAFGLMTERRAFKLKKKEFYKNGVHYTPSYICKTITNKTVHRSLNNKKNKDLEKLVCIDIACGSGSFLTSLYDSLYSIKYKEQKEKKSLISDGTKNVIDLKSRKKLIEKSIHGIDIDHFAVEVSKLCMYLKFFEDFPIGKSKLLKSEIPVLEENIICADSLLDTTIKNRFPNKLKAINSKHGKIFKIIKNKKADVVVGNPPYIKIQDLKKISSFPTELYKNIYKKTISNGSIEFAIAFIERGGNILSPDGELGYIVPNKIFKNKQGESIRHFLTEDEHVQVSLKEFIDFNSCQIFDASIYTCLLYLTNSAPSESFKCSQVYRMKDGSFTMNEINKTDKKYPSNEFEVANLKSQSITSDPWNLLVGIKRTIFMNLKNKFSPIKNIVPQGKIFQGIPTGSDKIFIVEKIKEKNSKIWTVTSEALEIKAKRQWEHNRGKKNEMPLPTTNIEKKYLRPIYMGSSDLKHFWKNESEYYLLFPYDSNGSLIDDKEFLTSNAYQYLNKPEHRNGMFDSRGKILLQGLDVRENGKFSGKSFYQFSRPQNLDLWAGEKIMFPYIAEHFNAHLDKRHTFVNVSTGGYAIIAPDKESSKYALLSILNSEIFNFLIKCFSGDFRGGWFECSNQYVGAIPIPPMTDVGENDLQDIKDTLESLYASSTILRSDSISSEERYTALNDLDSNMDWLNSWVSELYQISSEELDLVEFYSSGISDSEAASEIEELHRLVNIVEKNKIEESQIPLKAVSS